MAKKCLKFLLIVLIAVLYNTTLHAQGAGDVLRYSLQYPNYDPVSIVMPGVSDATGFGTYQQNPAAVALFEESFFSFGLSDRYVNEEGTFLGNTSSFDDNQANVGDIGFIYNVPTAQGKLTIGAGYSQSHDFNRAASGSARNNLSTLTDSYARLPIGDPLNEAAFNAFAIDDVEGENRSQSIFRFLPPGQQYPGINQDFEFTERGSLGEYSAFIATEFVKDFIVGASLGVINGNYEFRRDFLETDSNNDYNDAFIDTDNDGDGDTDIDTILSVDSIDQTFSGFSARLGFLYRVTPNVNIGGSYHFKNVLNIDEEFGTEITTNLDDGSTPFFGEDLGAFEYKIIRPARINFGFTATDLSGVTFSASAERVAYSEGRIEFESVDDNTAEDIENDIVASNLEDVFNLRFGLEYKVNEQFIPRVGYGYYPSPTGDFENEDLNGDRQFFSAGFTSRLNDNIKFNLAGQLATWDDQNTLYAFDDGNTTFGEVVTEEVMRWNFMGGIIFEF